MKEETNQNSTNGEVDSSTGSKEIQFRETLFKNYLKTSKEITMQCADSNTSIKIDLLQKGRINLLNKAILISYFYDQNFVGNKDFMHIPSITQIMQNIIKYPILLAKRKNVFGNEEIIGITTIKDEKNNSLSDNPFFPTQNENVLSITGILAKSNIYNMFGEKIKGIGKQLFKTAIRGAYEINKNSSIRLMCEIDCRNNNSMKSLQNAIKELQEENFNIKANLVGYYEIIKNNQELTEAPTFIFEIIFDKSITLKNKTIIFSYEKIQTTNLYNSLSQVIKNKTTEKQVYINSLNENIVKYHEIKPINILETVVEPGLTALGNDRIPVTSNFKYINMQKQSL